MRAPVVQEQDLSDRVVRIVLGGEPGRYFSPDPLGYAETHRDALIRESFHLLRSLTLDPAFRPITRMGGWEEVATSVARKLGLPYQFDAQKLDTPDGIVRELHHAVLELRDAHSSWPTAVDLAGHLRVGRDHLYGFRIGAS